MKNPLIVRMGLSVIFLYLFLSVSVVSAAEFVVRALLLFSSSRPRCQKVIAEDLPPITDRF